MPDINDFPLHNSMNKALNEQNRARAFVPRTPRAERASIKVLELLLDFAEEKIHKTMREGNSSLSLRACLELEDVLRSLILLGYREFEETMRQLDAAWARLLVATRIRLVRDYLDSSTPDEEAEQIHTMLCEIISRGAWPNWQEEYEEAVQAAIAGRKVVPLRAG
jgi:hypothetical protein